MTALELTGMGLAAEFALAALVMFFIMRQRQRTLQTTARHDVQAASEHLVEREPSRRESLQQLFATTYQMQGKALEARVEEFIARETAFYHAMLRVYLERDGAKLKELPDELLKVLAPWIELAPNAAPDAAAAALRTENARLTAELDSTKETIAQLLEEYNAAFARYQQTAEAAKAKVGVTSEREALDDDSSLDVLSKQPPARGSVEVDSDELIKELDDLESEQLADLFGDRKDARKP